MRERPIYYAQTDRRWRDHLYDVNPADGPDYLAASGCGPTAAAMVIAALADPTVTPPVLADFSVAHGDRTPTNGTSRTLFAHAAQAWRLGYALSFSQKEAKGCLDCGGLVVCHVGPGRWTRGGHYILWWDYDPSDCRINDPSGDTPRRSRAPLSELAACAKAYCCFFPPEGDEEETMTYEQWKAFLEQYRAERAQQEPAAWSEEDRRWAEEQGIIQGDERGEKKYRLCVTREELAAVLHRLKKLGGA